MFSTSHVRLRDAVSVAVVAIGTTLACASPAMALPQFTFDPTAGGLTGLSVTADNLLLSDYATITLTNPSGTAFHEVGVLAVTGFQLGPIQVVGTSLNTAYGLYFQFSADGTQTIVNNKTSFGDFTNLSYTLYGYTVGPNAVTYSSDGSAPANTGTITALASGSLIDGTVGTTGGAPSANATLVFAAGESPFFASPSPFYDLAFTSFGNATSEFSGTPATGFTITGGGGTANFAFVPEPISLALLGGGLLMTGMLRRRNKNVAA